jgi:hydrogenase nickel incorporation protein HypB
MAKIKIFENIMESNDRIATENKVLMGTAFSVNIMSSPGAGKTTLLENTLKELGRKYVIGVVEGDITTSNDANRLKKFAASSTIYQIKTRNYGGSCHLDAKMVSRALEKLGAGKKNYDAIIIENVGNLICPADYYLGEDKKAVMLAVTEGDDKPLKYPGMFEAADLVILNKIDLLKHVKFSTKNAIRNIKKINKKAIILQISGQDKKGAAEWCSILEKWIREKKAS